MSTNKTKHAELDFEIRSSRTVIPSALEFVRTPEIARSPALDQPPWRRRIMTARRDTTPIDVICGGMYRACSTWQYEVVAHLITDFQGGHRLGLLDRSAICGTHPFRASSRHEAPLTTTQWRVVKVA